MNTVLHITPHLGGGVGKVLSNVCKFSKDNRYKHTIILLEEPEQHQFVNIALENQVEVLIVPSKSIIENKIKESDIVQIEWWNHPLTCEFLCNFPEIPVRIVIWSHISGCSYPYIKKDLIMKCNKFLFTSPYSLENPYLKDKHTEEIIKGKTDVVYSSGGFNNIQKKAIVKKSTFNIGYVGTLNFCKLNPEFVDYCNEVNIENSKFIIVGDDSIKDKILCNSDKKDICDKFEFVGYIDKVQEQLERFDVFGYPLNKGHYGTTENALLEAMAAGIPPVVLNQCTEKYLVKNMETGIVVDNKNEYGAAIRYLFKNPEERIKIGNNARKYVLENFSLESTMLNLNRNYDLVMKNDKKEILFNDILGGTPSEWFLFSLGDEKLIFEESRNILDSCNDDKLIKNRNKIKRCKQVLKERNKSSIYQFQRYFQDDKLLCYWKNTLEMK